MLEAILLNEELWLSNPLFMNDKEEVNFGINTRANLFLASPEIESACETKERFDAASMLRKRSNQLTGLIPGFQTARCLEEW